MEFSDFVKLLYPAIGAGGNTHAFTKSILETIVTDEGQAVLDERSPDTYKAYFNGNTKITKLAQSITAYIEPEEFIGYIEQFSDAAVQSLCDSFQEYLPDINLHNAGEKLDGLFAAIIKEAASTKKKGTPRGAKKDKQSANSRINEAIFKSGAVVAEIWSSVVEQLIPASMGANILSGNDKQLLEKFKSDSKNILRYIMDNDPSGGATSITLADEMSALAQTWKYDLREIKDDENRKLIIEIFKVLNEYTYYISEKFLRLLPDRGVLWFRNESLEEGEQLREVLRPQSCRLRCAIGEFYKKLFPIPEDNDQEEAETIEAEVVDDEEPSGAAKEDTENKKTTVIQQQTNVVQNGENNFNLTNNGTMNFKF